MSITLFEQPFATTIRTISGIVNEVTQEDYVLLCDTTSSPVVLDLASIPTNYWSTQYKLFVVDSGNNASSNSITINAPLGFTINGQPSASIIVNGAGYMITISSNTNYAGLYSGVISGTTSVGLVNITNAGLLALVSAGTVSAGQFYFVTNVSNVDYASGEGVAIQGIKVNGTTTVEGSGTFWNADYQGVGDYSGVPSYVNNVGIWSPSPNIPASFVNGSVVIYNNLNYINISGTWGSAPSGDAVNWLLLGKSKTNGYILEQDVVKYDIINNVIVYRADKRNNEVDSYTNGGNNSIAKFQWGRDAVKYNKVIGNSLMLCTNSWANFSGNVLENATFTDTTPYNALGSGTISYNRFGEGANITFTRINTGISFTNNVMEVVTSDLKIVSTSIQNKRCVSGFSNFEVILTYPLHWKSATKQLKIDASYVNQYNWVGVFYLRDFPDYCIEIDGLPTNHPSTFLVDPLSAFSPFLWFITDIATAQTNPLRIVGSSTFVTVSSNNGIAKHTNGNDFAVIQKAGNLNQVVNFNAMA